MKAGAGNHDDSGVRKVFGLVFVNGNQGECGVEEGSKFSFGERSKWGERLFLVSFVRQIGNGIKWNERVQVVAVAYSTGTRPLQEGFKRMFACFSESGQDIDLFESALAYYDCIT